MSRVQMRIFMNTKLLESRISGQAESILDSVFLFVIAIAGVLAVTSSL